MFVEENKTVHSPKGSEHEKEVEDRVLASMESQYSHEETKNAAR